MAVLKSAAFEISSLRNCADFSLVLPWGSFPVLPFQFEMALVIIGLYSKVAILAEYPRYQPTSRSCFHK